MVFLVLDSTYHADNSLVARTLGKLRAVEDIPRLADAILLSRRLLPLVVQIIHLHPTLRSKFDGRR